MRVPTGLGLLHLRALTVRSCKLLPLRFGARCVMSACSQSAMRHPITWHGMSGCEGYDGAIMASNMQWTACVGHMPPSDCPPPAANDHTQGGTASPDKAQILLRCWYRVPSHTHAFVHEVS